MKISKDESIAILDELISEANEAYLSESITKESLKEWVYQLEVALDRIFPRNSKEHGIVNEHDETISILGACMNSSMPRGSVYASKGAAQITNQVNALRMIQKNIVKGKIAPGNSLSSISLTPQALVENICHKFHLVAKQLKSRRQDRSTLIINDEYDAQDLFHSLLRVHFDDIRPESWVPDYAGGSSRTDFLLKQENIVIEIKKTRDSLKDKHVGEQLIIDIVKYKEHPNCKTLICFVYDPEGWIANPTGLENDLRSKSDDEVAVQVIIVPKGQ